MAITNKRYEVLGYKTQTDLDNRHYEVVAEHETIRGATLFGVLGLSDYEFIKIQSYDREFIKIITEAK
jgi:hypothetical protein